MQRREIGHRTAWVGSTMRIDVLTTFPEMFTAEPGGVLGSSMPKRAIEAGVLEVRAVNLRAYALNKHNRTDDRPFGGGPGMVMTCQPIWDAVQASEKDRTSQPRRVLLTPQGIPLTQRLVADLASGGDLLLLAGHYEGIDERVVQRLDPLEVSIGDFVLSSGELAALALIDAVARLLPGVLGDESSASEDSFEPVPACDGNGDEIPQRVLQRWCHELGITPDTPLLDCPHYTRPREWEGMSVPEALLSGDHEAIARWRLEARVARTRTRRPDLLKGQ